MAVIPCVHAPAQTNGSDEAAVNTQTLSLVDEARKRSVPVVIYAAAAPASGKLKPAIISRKISVPP